MKRGIAKRNTLNWFLIVILLLAISLGIFYFEKSSGKISGKVILGDSCVDQNCIQLIQTSELIYDPNMTTLIGEYDTTTNKPCTLNPDSIWKFVDFSNNSYFCHNLPQPKSTNPITYAVGENKKFISYGNGRIQLIYNSTAETERGCSSQWPLFGIVQPIINPEALSSNRYWGIDLANYSNITFNLKFKINSLNREYNCPNPMIWPQYNSFDQIHFYAVISPKSDLSKSLTFGFVLCDAIETLNEKEGCINIFRNNSYPNSGVLIYDQYGLPTYILPTNSKYPLAVKGQWINYSFDMKQAAQEALTASYKVLPGFSSNIDDYIFGGLGGSIGMGITFGPELSGGYYQDMEFDKLSLAGSRLISTFPICTEKSWTSSLSPETCPSSGNQIKTWTLLDQCREGVQHNSSEITSCVYGAPTCFNFTYSDWTECSVEGIQKRNYLQSFPAGCQNGNPILVQNCTQFYQNLSENTEINISIPLPSRDYNNLLLTTTNITSPTDNFSKSMINYSLAKNQETKNIKSRFIKFFCRISHLFNKEKYTSCVNNYMR